MREWAHGLLIVAWFSSASSRGEACLGLSNPPSVSFSVSFLLSLSLPLFLSLSLSFIFPFELFTFAGNLCFYFNFFLITLFPLLSVKLGIAFLYLFGCFAVDIKSFLRILVRSTPHLHSED